MIDKEKFIEIYTRYFPELCLFLANYSADRDRNRDIVQDIFVKLAGEDISRIRNIRGYLYFAARNAVLNLIRDENNRRLILLDPAMEVRYGDDETGELSLEERIVTIEKAIESLPPECRDIFIKAKRQGMRYKDIARAKGISVKTVAAQMGIALRRIRDLCK